MTNPNFTGKTTATPEQTEPKATMPHALPLALDREDALDRNLKGDGNHRFAAYVKDTVSPLEKLAIELPSEITAKPLASPNGVVQILKEQVPEAFEDHIGNAARALLEGKNPSEHLTLHNAWSLDNRALLQRRVFELEIEVWFDNLNKHAENFIEQIRDKIVNPALDALDQLLALHPGKQWNLNQAVKECDFLHAAVIKEAESHASKLATAYEARRKLYNEDAFTTDAAWVTEPGLTSKPDPASLQWWMTLLEAGHEPHYPTGAEWQHLDNSEAFTEHRQQQAQRKADALAAARAAYEAPPVKGVMTASHSHGQQ